MLPWAQRLRHSAEITALYQHGRKIQHPVLRIMYQPAIGCGSRATVVVSKRLSNLAVERNQVKRRLRAIIQKQLPKLKQPLDLLIITQPRARTETFHSLEQIVITLFNKHQLYVEPSQ